MHIPQAWAKASAECQTQDNRKLRVAVWGWGGEQAAAMREAASRLERLIGRIRRGDPFPGVYAYGSRPLREEILQTFAGETEDPKAVLTRNRYGALVLNTAHLLFLDIDLPPPAFSQRLRRLFSRSQSADDDDARAKLRDALRQIGRATFRLYRTAAGFRAIAVDREFDPAGGDAQKLMNATGTDPAFVRLTLAQRSFRARLTPKPWRCNCTLPPGEHPRTDDRARQRFTAWLNTYEQASRNYATCRYIETIGAGSVRGTAADLVALHDRVTRCGESLPLA
jgi:hypothetical protein